MSYIKIKIATDFTDAPGARSKTDGANSGEEFFEKLLKPKFVEVKTVGGKLFIDFDDSWGYASSFISGAFGALADEFGKNTVLKYLEFKSDDDSALIDKVKTEINKSSNNG
jgi:hypothetical protein